MEEKFEYTKGKSEAINQRTENTMTIRKRTKGQTTIYTENIHIKLKIE